MVVVLTDTWVLEQLIHEFNHFSVSFTTFYGFRGHLTYTLQDQERLLIIRVHDPLVELHVLCVNEQQALRLKEHIEYEYDTDSSRPTG